MATSPLGRGELPFKIPTGIDAIKAIDGEFWRLHAQWRLLEDEFESDRRFPDECEEQQALLDRSTDARDAMFRRPIWTAAALMTKLAACHEGGAASLMDQELHAGFTVFDHIRFDSERVFQREAGYWEPMLAL